MKKDSGEKLRKVKKQKRTFIATFTAEVIEGKATSYRGWLKDFCKEVHFPFKLEKVLMKKTHGGASHKDKGFGFEREIAREISLWWTGGEDAYVFTRRGGSGGRKADKIGATGYGGDLHADKETGFPLVNLFSFEFKNRNDMDPSFALFPGNYFLEAWDKCKTDADVTKRIPCLIYRREKATCICFSKAFFQHMREWFNIPNDNIIRVDEIVIMSLKYFFAIFEPDVFFFLDRRKKGGNA